MITDGFVVSPVSNPNGVITNYVQNILPLFFNTNMSTRARLA